MACHGRVVTGRAVRFLATALIAQGVALPAPHLHAESLPAKPSLPPSFTIPVEPLGYSAPGVYYMGQRYSMASLDFLGEDRLLFTFHSPGLLRRDNASPEPRQIRSLVLALPSGAVLSDTLWTVHGRNRYLWVLPDGHFFLRDLNTIVEGDASLQSNPLFQFPGELLWIESDPSGQYLVTDSREPENTSGKTASPNDASQAATDSSVHLPNYVVRILRRDTGRVLLVSRSMAVVHLPISAEGYLEPLQGEGSAWVLNLNYFSGGSRVVGRLDSDCAPTLDFLTTTTLFASGCDDTGRGILAAFTTSGRRLWLFRSSTQDVWPLLVTAASGSRLARETLAVDQPVTNYSPLNPDDIKGQIVRVFDAATGKLVLIAPAEPALDAGGNVAISPSGRRVAILTHGSIQIFDISATPPLPAAGPSQP